MNWACPSAPITPQKRMQPLSLEVSPFDRFCISSLSPLQSAKRMVSPNPSFRPLSPQILWSTEQEGEALRQARVVKKIDFSEVSENYEFKARSVTVHVHLSSEELFAEEVPQVRQRKASQKKVSCGCTRSKCLRFYCECFAANLYCSNCNCKNCFNLPDYEAQRTIAYNHSREKKNLGMYSKESSETHRGCNCKRSACLKNYCECFQANQKCLDTCKCVGCKNYLIK